jgi:hypothetical protein
LRSRARTLGRRQDRRHSSVDVGGVGCRASVGKPRRRVAVGATSDDLGGDQAHKAPIRDATLQIRRTYRRACARSTDRSRSILPSNRASNLPPMRRSDRSPVSGPWHSPTSRGSRHHPHQRWSDDDLGGDQAHKAPIRDATLQILPLTSAPISIYLAIEQGEQFASDAAVGSVTGLGAASRQHREQPSPTPPGE